jgi:hypothetical protein
MIRIYSSVQHMALRGLNADDFAVSQFFNLMWFGCTEGIDLGCVRLRNI